MKKGIKIGIVLSTCFLLLGNAWADNAEFRLILSRNDMVVAGEFHVDLEIRIATGSTSPRTLNSLLVDLYYSTSLTQWISDPSTNWGPSAFVGYVPSVDRLAGYYRVMIVPGAIGPSGFPGWNVTTGWQRVATLKWTINSLNSANVTISDGTDAAGYYNNLGNNPDDGILHNWDVSNQDLGDISLPVQMTNFTAQSTSREGVTLNWTTESETNSAGFHVWRGESENAINKRVTSALIPSSGNSSSRNDYTFTDRSAHGKTFWYKIEEVSLTGQSQFLGPIAVEAALPLPEEFSVSRNYPNPFNPETTVHYELPEDGLVSVRVFDLLGREVKMLADGHMTAGRYDVKWDGTNHLGNAVSSGMYFVRVQAGEFSAVRKMTLMR